MRRAARRLQSRVMVAFAGVTLLVAAVFGLFAMAFTYSVEDAFFDARLVREADAQQAHHAAHGRWRTPPDPSMRLYTHPRGFPEDLALQHAREPARREFPGAAGRYYHVRVLRAPDGAAAWLVDEVGQELVVRPIRSRMLALLAGTGGVLLGLSLLLAWFVARRTTGPLSRLANAVDAMAPGQPLPALDPGPADDEVGILARGLAALDGRIQAFVDREREFTRDASHELRTPLAVIASAAERLLAEPGLPPLALEQLAHVQRSARQLEQTVAMLLALARETRPDDGPPPETLLRSLVEQVVVEQSPRLESKAVRVVVDVADEARLPVPRPVGHVLLSNLIGNAFAHTLRGEVRIEATRAEVAITNEGELEGRVDGEGEGVRPFRKGARSTGEGFGLALVIRLAHRHGLGIDVRQTESSVAVRLAPAGPDEARLA